MRAGNLSRASRVATRPNQLKVRGDRLHRTSRGHTGLPRTKHYRSLRICGLSRQTARPEGFLIIPGPFHNTRRRDTEPLHPTSAEQSFQRSATEAAPREKRERLEGKAGRRLHSNGSEVRRRRLGLGAGTATADTTACEERKGRVRTVPESCSSGGRRAPSEKTHANRGLKSPPAPPSLPPSARRL